MLGENSDIARSGRTINLERQIIAESLKLNINHSDIERSAKTIYLIKWGKHPTPHPTLGIMITKGYHYTSNHTVNININIQYKS